VPDLVGLSSVPFGQVAHAHPVVRDIARRWPGYRQTRSHALYGRLVATALAQKVTGKNSKTVLKRLVWRWGLQAPGPHPRLRLLPPARELARVPYHDFHPLGIERHRADLVKRIADRLSALERSLSMPAAEGRAHLEKLRGIGPWTSGVVAAWAFGDADAVPWGDYHLPNYVAYNLAGEPRADDARMATLLAPYEGVRGMVVRAVKAGGTTPPRYGPKTAVRDIREW
jgi:3-methyladenine DNA glycosylase/8-oxoguanine DNA glycosylase